MGVFSIFMVLKTMILKETFQAESEKGGKKGIRGVSIREVSQIREGIRGVSNKRSLFLMGNKEWPPREEYDMRSSTMRLRENGVSRKR